MPNDYISPLTVNGLRGRVLNIPGPKGVKREVMFVYGHHSSLERWFGIAKSVSSYANVTMPDLPGFGGMQSLYTQGKSANLDNLADWLADFIKQHYGKRRLTIIGMSLGFVIITRMLQRHPKLCGQIDLLISLFGFASHKDFYRFTPTKRLINALACKFFSLPVTSTIFRVLALNELVLRRLYHLTPNARQKFKDASPEQHKLSMDFEVSLWHANDVRTHMKTAAEFLTFDNTGAKVSLPVYHIAVQNDRYFSLKSVETHFRQIFSGYHLLAELNGSHAPSFVLDAELASAFVPEELLKLITRK